MAEQSSSEPTKFGLKYSGNKNDKKKVTGFGPRIFRSGGGGDGSERSAKEESFHTCGPVVVVVVVAWRLEALTKQWNNEGVTYTRTKALRRRAQKLFWSAAWAPNSFRR